MKKARKIVSIIVTLCFLLTLVPAGAFAAPKDTEVPFDDVQTTDWFYDTVQYVYDEGLMAGTGDRIFSPQQTTTRGMIVTILHRMAGSPEAEAQDFTDVDVDAWYAPAISWSIESGVGAGYGGGLFGPDDAITREQMASFLYRYAELKDYDVSAVGDLNDFADASAVSDWAEDVMSWALGAELFAGRDNNQLAPQGLTTRAEAATILMRYCENIVEEEVDEPDEPVVEPDDPTEDPDTPVVEPDDPIDEPNDPNEVIQVTKEATGDRITASVTVALKGSQIESLSVTPLAPNDFFDSTVPGYLGSAFDFNVEGTFDEATIAFTYQSEDSPAEPTIYHWNEEAKMLEEVATTVEGNTAFATVTHFSTYVLLDKMDFDTIWENEIRPPEEASDKNGLDVVFVIDSSGSMDDNDENDLRLAAAKAFVDKLGAQDRAAVIDFDYYASVYQSFTNDKNALYQAIDRIDSSGGTSLSAGISSAIQQFGADLYDRNDAYKYIIFLTDGDGDYSSSYTTTAAENEIVIYTIGLGSGVRADTLKQIAEGTGGKYYAASTANNLGDIYYEISNETVDYSTDSNNDGISDYFTQLLCDGTLRLGSGKVTPFAGIAYEDIQANNDYDGDGIVNGDELSVIYWKGLGVYVNMISDPTHKDQTTNVPGQDDPGEGSENQFGEPIFDEVENWWGFADSTYEYNGKSLVSNKYYNAPGTTDIARDMVIPNKATVRVDGDLTINGKVTLEPNAKLICTGALNVAANGILDLAAGGSTIECVDFVFGPNESHSKYLSGGVISVSGNVEIKNNFYASGNNKFQITGGNRHAINVWDQWIEEDQYFNDFHIIGYGLPVLDVKEPFQCKGDFIADDWKWLNLIYYGEDFVITGPGQNDKELVSNLQTAFMLALAQHGNKAIELNGISYIRLDLDSYTHKIYEDNRILTYTLTDLQSHGMELASGTALNGSFKYNGQQYLVAMSPDLMNKIFEDFKNTATISLIEEIGSEYIGAYRNLIRANIIELLPQDLSDAFQVTTVLCDYADVFKKYYELM